jgi:hypothetical protein
LEEDNELLPVCIISLIKPSFKIYLMSRVEFFDGSLDERIDGTIVVP